MEVRRNSDRLIMIAAVSESGSRAKPSRPRNEKALRYALAFAGSAHVFLNVTK
jgi:hypothetical protein